MGTDIHSIVEIRENDKWHYVPDMPYEFSRANRDYDLFALLAGIRDDFCTNNFKVKGLPADISGMKFDFRNERDIWRKYYETQDKPEKVHLMPDGRYKIDIGCVEEARREVTYYEYFSWQGTKGVSNDGYLLTYYIYDPALIGAKEVIGLWRDFYPSFEEYFACQRADAMDWDEDMQEYGHYNIDFNCEDYHTHSYITLREMYDFDYTDYLMEKCYVSGSLWYNFKRLGGVLPDGMSVVSEPSPRDFVMSIRQSVLRDVLIQWYSEDKEEAFKKTSMYKGMTALNEIAGKYNVFSDDIRLVFAFDN